MKPVKRMWDIRQSAQPATLDIHIYGDVQGDSIDLTTLKNVESNTSAEHFKKELAKYPDVKKINIYINSYGGSVFEGTAIFSQLKRHQAYKTVYVDGFACSIASVIAMAGDKVVMPKNTLMLIHNVWCSAYGNAVHLRNVAENLDKMTEASRQAYLQKSSGRITEKKLIELMDAETWLTASQCKQYGFADEVLDKEADLAEAKKMLQKAKKAMEQEEKKNTRFAARVTDRKGELMEKELKGGSKPLKMLAALLK